MSREATVHYLCIWRITLHIYYKRCSNIRVILEGVCMRPENLTKMKFQPTIKEILFKLLFCVRKEMEFRWGDPRKTAYSVKTKHFCFDEINACADVLLYMISFPVVFTWYFITRNEIHFLSKRPQWNDTRNESNFALYHVNSYKQLSRHWNESISLRPKCKQARVIQRAKM